MNTVRVTDIGGTLRFESLTTGKITDYVIAAVDWYDDVTFLYIINGPDTDKYTWESLITVSSRMDFETLIGKPPLIPSVNGDATLNVGISANQVPNLVERNIVTIRVKNMFQGVSISFPINLVNAIVGTTIFNVLNFNIRVNATFAVALTYSDVDTANSYVEQSTTNSDVTGGIVSYSVNISAFSTAGIINLREIMPSLATGDTITISSRSLFSGSGNVYGSFNWIEFVSS